MAIFNNLTNALKKTSSRILNGISNIFHEKKYIDIELIDQIESLLLSSDIGVNVTRKIIDMINKKYSVKDLPITSVILEQISNIIESILLPCQIQFPILSGLNVLLICGVNGHGKTTTIGKLGYFLKKQNKKVLFGACDTFRAAAIEQLELWSKNIQCDIFFNYDSKDPSSVAFKATEMALNNKHDFLIIDTAGRLNNQTTLMSELEKIMRVINKHSLPNPVNVLLVLDAGVGQNAIQQVEQFKKAANVGGLIITKLDGTSKAGILVSIAEKFSLPIYFIGFGEKVNDLKEFNAKEFVHSLLSRS